jgi:hypothetical protein
MEINITRFVQENEPSEYSASAMERGPNAGKITWANALREGTATPLLTTPDEIEALRSYVADFGAWSREEIAAWTQAECNAIFIQLISGDLREAGFDECDPDEFDWEAYNTRAEEGQISGNFFQGKDGEIYYSLSR